MHDTTVARFKTPRDERRFHEVYAQLRAERFPSPPTEADVETPLGTAHTFSWDGSGTPVLLLPGWRATAVMWAPMLVHGFDGRPVHTVDLVCDVGLSVQRRPITDLGDNLPWIDAVADGLGLERVHVVGASYGGALALAWAAHAPDRVATSSLLDPGGIADVDLRRFIAWGAKVFAASVVPMPLRRRLAARLHASMILDTDLIALGRIANTRTVSAAAPGGDRALPDAVLRAVTVPTLALLAEHSAIMPPREAAARARDLLPDATVEIVAGAGHSLPADDAAWTADRVRGFLHAHETPVHRELPADG